MLDNLDRDQLIEKVCDALEVQNHLVAGSGWGTPPRLVADVADARRGNELLGTARSPSFWYGTSAAVVRSM